METRIVEQREAIFPHNSHAQNERFPDVEHFDVHYVLLQKKKRFRSRTTGNRRNFSTITSSTALRTLSNGSEIPMND